MEVEAEIREEFNLGKLMRFRSIQDVHVLSLESRCHVSLNHYLYPSPFRHISTSIIPLLMRNHSISKPISPLMSEAGLLPAHILLKFRQRLYAHRCRVVGGNFISKSQAKI